MESLKVPLYSVDWRSTKTIRKYHHNDDIVDVISYMKYQWKTRTSRCERAASCSVFRTSDTRGKLRKNPAVGLVMWRARYNCSDQHKTNSGVLDWAILPCLIADTTGWLLWRLCEENWTHMLFARDCLWPTISDIVSYKWAFFINIHGVFVSHVSVFVICVCDIPVPT